MKRIKQCLILTVLIWSVGNLLWATEAGEVDLRLTKNLYIIFDASGSMWQQKCAGGDYKIHIAKNALITFLSNVPSSYNLGLYVFDDHGPREMYPLGTIDRSRFKKELSRIFAGGKTPLGKAIDYACQVLNKQKDLQLGYGEYTLLVVTDGEADDMAALPAQVERVTDHGIIIQVIGFCLESEHSLKRLVHKYREANSPDELASALQAVLGEAEQYSDLGVFTE
ncbi:VWA domain-containing protein [bacterium]|nr:VWA domain-containing protein [bacterium]